MRVTVKKEVPVRYLKVDVNVRYDEEDIPNDAPMRRGSTWVATIDLNEQKVLDWPQGKTLSMEYMKVCDEGTYALYDEDMNMVIEKDGYVPNKLLPGDYGDYLSLNIDESGKITNWLAHPDLSDFEDHD